MARIRQRRDTTANWEIINPVLQSGEFGWETDGSQGLKIGDGVTAWTGLAYLSTPGGGGGGGYTQGQIEEFARDALGTSLTAGAGITITPNDGGDIITIASSISQYSDENVRDVIGTALTSGTYVTVTVNDGSDTITIEGNSTSIAELIRDTIGTALTEGAGIVKTVNDGSDTITLASDAVGFASYATPNWPARPSYDTVIWSSTDYTAATPSSATGNDIVIMAPLEEVWEFALSSDGADATALTTGIKQVWRTPAAITITRVRASVSTVSSSGVITVDISEGAGSGTSLMTTNKLQIDAGEETSTTASTPAVITDSSLADDARVSFEVDAAGADAKGLKVKLYGYRV